MGRQRQTRTADASRGLIDPDRLDRLITTCQETERYCALCDAAGLDVTPERKKNADQLATAISLKKTFFPTRV